VTIEKEIVQIEEGSIQSSERSNLVAEAEGMNVKSYSRYSLAVLIGIGYPRTSSSFSIIFPYHHF